jgi:hypothetical protein
VVVVAEVHPVVEVDVVVAEAVVVEVVRALSSHHTDMRVSSLSKAKMKTLPL